MTKRWGRLTHQWPDNGYRRRLTDTVVQPDSGVNHHRITGQGSGNRVLPKRKVPARISGGEQASDGKDSGDEL